MLIACLHADISRLGSADPRRQSLWSDSQSIRRLLGRAVASDGSVALSSVRHA